MDALASASVGIVHGDSVLHFEPRRGPGGATHYDYAALGTPVAEQASRPHESVFESGLRWHLVPERLYRYEDRRDYLLASHPNVSREIGVVAIPSVGALGVFERTAGAPPGTDADHHLCELLIESARAIAPRRSDLAVVFFLEGDLWMVIHRGGALLHAQGRPFADGADAVFALAALLHQYGLERAATPLYVGGAVTADSQLARDLAIYFDVRPLESGFDRAPAPAQLLLAYGHALRSGLYAPTPPPDR